MANESKTTIRKRVRRRYNEIERHYCCKYPGCTKSYGTLNHLNDHIQLQSHGPRHTPDMYRELRSRLRKPKDGSSTQLCTKPNSRPLKLCIDYLIH
ncbi:hypothetical protein L0F63_001015 [Massospora cicadina]|nr:hypothetical protein L0F63_001015 [Massospora cicadina]